MYSKLTKFLLIIIIASNIMWAQSKKDEIIVAKFKGSTISLDEFEAAYAKNVGGIENAKKDSLSSYVKFLDLYVKYKIKLAEAKEKGFDKDLEILNELNEYKEQISSGYLIEKYIIEPETKKLYERRKWEYRVSHIMFIPEKGKEDSTFKFAETVLKSIKDGIDFVTLAKKYSQDHNSALYGGDISYVTAGFLPLDFENAVYETNPGEVYPYIVKTKYGYHIIKVTDKRLRIPEIRASHILISFSTNGKIDSANAYKQAIMILDSLKAGGDFAELATKYSRDIGTLEKGGDLGFFKRRTMVRPFDEAVFNLKKVGDISDIVMTKYGYHIIKLTGKLKTPTYEEDKQELTDLFKKNRYNEAVKKLAEKLKPKYEYSFNTTNFVKLVETTDTLMVGQTNDKLDKLKKLEIFKFKDKSYTIEDVLNIIYSKRENSQKKMTPNFLSNEIENASNEKVLHLEASRLEDLNPQFADLMKDYKKGILVFKIQQTEVWNKIKIDSVKLQDFFNANRDKYIWPDSVDFTEIFSRSDSLLKHYLKLYKQGESFDTLASKYTERGGFKKKGGNWGMRRADFNDLTKKASTLKNPGEISDLYQNYGGYSLIRLNKRIPAHKKTFKEAKNEVAAAYQEIQAHNLENEYLRKLEKKYEPVILQENLSEAFK